MFKEKKVKIIIEGITEEGAKFRPSDWAERMCGSLSTYRNHRLFYSPLLRPSFRHGIRCVVLDPHLKEKNPELYKHIMDFAKANRLKMRTDEETHENHKNQPI